MYILVGLAFMFYQFEVAQVAYLLAFTTSVYLIYALLATRSFDPAKLIACFFVSIAIAK